MNNLGLHKQNSGNSRSPQNYSKKYDNLFGNPNYYNKSPSNFNVQGNGYSSVRYYDATSGDKENINIMKKVKHLKQKYQNSISDKPSFTNAHHKMSTDSSK